MNIEQAIEIAQVSFPDRVKQFIDFDNLRLFKLGDVYRLIDADVRFVFALPETEYFSVHLPSYDKDFCQIEVGGSRAFNHAAAIDKLREFNLLQ